MTSVAKVTSGGLSEDWEIKEGRNDRREAQVWKADVIREMHRSCSKQRIDVEAPFETDGGKDG